MIVQELIHVDDGLVEQIISLEQAAFGIGGMNRWFLVPFIRHGRVFVALHVGELIGVCEYMLDFRREAHAYLFGITVKESWRRRGIGAMLLKESSLTLRESGIRTVSLTVHPDNQEALSLYEKLGFRPIVFREHEYGVGEHRWEYELDLSNLKE
ncbi:MAG: GNAT family N-acetyltransferase [Firmicutes bacterium]|jgi:ribosomal-protein-alanine N-acetyltransferase|nr:GNAT family N-acetyltransferase [Bacillota bacterium]